MLNSGHVTYQSLIAGLLLILAACSGSTGKQPNELREITSRETKFLDYPEGGNTYLTFSQSHGFQVNYLATAGRAWLWYPGNDVAVPELWRLDLEKSRVCWSHPPNSYNPVTGQSGGQESCESLSLARKLVIAKLQGDPYNLSGGRVPSKLDKCTAPDEFQFDRGKYGCK